MFKMFVRLKSNWIRQHHLSDPYVKQAKIDGYRARSVYKLQELNSTKLRIKPGFRIIELGAAPGAWTQLLVELVNARGLECHKPRGFVLSADILDFDLVEGAVCLGKCDVLSEKGRKMIKEQLTNNQINQIDLLISDACPNISGIAEIDIQKLVDLQRTVFCVHAKYLKSGGSFMAKLFEGPESTDFQTELKNYFGTKIEAIKPKASRPKSREFYLVCRNHKK